MVKKYKQPKTTKRATKKKLVRKKKPEAPVKERVAHDPHRFDHVGETVKELEQQPPPPPQPELPPQPQPPAQPEPEPPPPEPKEPEPEEPPEASPHGHSDPT
jgi:hypothetical protein